MELKDFLNWKLWLTAGASVLVVWGIMVLMILVLTPEAQAVSKISGISGISGHLAVDYDTISNNWIGEAYIQKELGRLIVAGRLTTYMNEFRMKDDKIPAGVPDSQRYDLELHFKVTKEVQVYLIEGCNHYFDQSSKGNRWDDESYLRLGLKYQF